MASKRMFDKAIIDTDKFMDLSMSSKALYFLLGMEADDEGFVSYKKVMRIHGGNDDDIKILLAKNFLIGFNSGVVVITDWNKNNWLDSRRIKPTEYQKEKKLLEITNDRYVLSKCLTSIEESSIEENRIEQSRVEENLTPSQEARDFFNGGYESIFEEIKRSTGIEESSLKSELQKFILYWTERTKSGTKQRWETERTFEVKRRLTTWLSRVNNFTNKKEVKII